MDFIEELGTLALGTRIKNLSELLMRDVSRIYKDQDVDFEPRWFTLFQLILCKTEISVTEIARELKQTHPAVVQVVNSLEKKRLITTRKDKADQRKRLVRLTKKGKKLAKDLSPVWEAVHQAAQEILTESDPDLLNNIAKVEKALKQKSTYQRIKEKLINNAINEITDPGEYARKLSEDLLTENGGAHPVAPHIINDNFIVRVPFGRAVNPITNSNWEGTGIDPHVKTTKAEAMDVAYMMALDSLMKKEENEDIKKGLMWAYESLKAKLKPFEISEKTMEKYVGSYGPRNITLENGELYYQREDRPKMKMIALTEDTFSFAEISYFRLKVIMKDGTAVAVEGHYDNGRTDRNERSK